MEYRYQPDLFLVLGLACSCCYVACQQGFPLLFLSLDLNIDRALVAAMRAKFQKDVKPQLDENERWRNRSRRANFDTCLPGQCYKPVGTTNSGPLTIDESD